MAKSKKRTAFPGGSPTPSPDPATRKHAAGDRRPIRWDLIVLFLAISLGGTFLAILLRPKNGGERFTYQKIQTYPHDSQAFTQGLVYEDGYLWESTGLKGRSSVRQVELETGKVVKQTDLDKQYFGEGLTLLNDQLFQLTWQEHQAFVYDRELNQIKSFDYDSEGWGLTTNGKELIFSDGTSIIQFLDPETFQTRRSIKVRRGGFRVGKLNELEYAGGKIFANVYQTDLIYEIDPSSGDVTSVIDLTGLWPSQDRPEGGILNGIAFHTGKKRLLVTGKLCPYIYELELLPAK